MLSKQQHGKNILSQICLFYMKGKPVVLQSWLQQCAKLVLKTEQSNAFPCFISNSYPLKTKNKVWQPLILHAAGLFFSAAAQLGSAGV